MKCLNTITLMLSAVAALGKDGNNELGRSNPVVTLETERQLGGSSSSSKSSKPRYIFAKSSKSHTSAKSSKSHSSAKSSKSSHLSVLESQEVYSNSKDSRDAEFVKEINLTVEEVEAASPSTLSADSSTATNKYGSDDNRTEEGNLTSSDGANLMTEASQIANAPDSVATGQDQDSISSSTSSSSKSSIASSSTNTGIDKETDTIVIETEDNKFFETEDSGEYSGLRTSKSSKQSYIFAKSSKSHSSAKSSKSYSSAKSSKSHSSAKSSKSSHLSVLESQEVYSNSKDSRDAELVKEINLTAEEVEAASPSTLSADSSTATNKYGFDDNRTEEGNLTSSDGANLMTEASQIANAPDSVATGQDQDSISSSTSSSSKSSIASSSTNTGIDKETDTIVIETEDNKFFETEDSGQYSGLRTSKSSKQSYIFAKSSKSHSSAKSSKSYSSAKSSKSHSSAKSSKSSHLSVLESQEVYSNSKDSRDAELVKEINLTAEEVEAASPSTLSADSSTATTYRDGFDDNRIGEGNLTSSDGANLMTGASQIANAPNSVATGQDQDSISSSTSSNKSSIASSSTNSDINRETDTIVIETEDNKFFETEDSGEYSGLRTQNMIVGGTALLAILLAIAGVVVHRKRAAEAEVGATILDSVKITPATTVEKTNRPSRYDTVAPVEDTGYSCDVFGFRHCLA